MNYLKMFHELVWAIAMSKGARQDAVMFAEDHGLDSTVIKVLHKSDLALNWKSAIQQGSTANDAALVAYSSMVEAWYASLVTISALDCLLANGARTVPPGLRFASTSSFAVGETVAELGWAQANSISFDESVLVKQKGMAVVILSDEMVRFAAPAGSSLLNTELQNATAHASNGPVIAALTAGATVIGSTGNSRTDLRKAFAAVPLKQGSRPVIMSSPDVIKQLALLGSDTGPAMWPDMSVLGGSCGGAPAIGVDYLAEYDTSGSALLVVDAAQVAADAGVLEVLASRQADVRMTDESGMSGDTAQQMTSMFQTSSTAIRAKRDYAIGKIRENACAIVLGVNYDPS